MSNATQIRGPYRKGRERQQEIIENAVDVFGKFGYHKGSLRRIADLVHVTPALLLHHFGSKEGLLTAVLHHWDQESDHLTGTDFTGLAFIEKQRIVMRHNSTVRGLIELFSSLSTEASDPEHPAHEFYIERYQRVLSTFQHAFETAQEAGEIRADLDPTIEARGLIALMDGLQIQWLLDPAMPMADVFDECLDALITRVRMPARA